MAVINQGLVQKLYNMFPTPSPPTRAAKHSLADETQHNSDGVIEASASMETKHKNATPGMALAVTTQPAGRVSIASFPGGNGDEQEQHMPRASDSCNDGLARSGPQVERVNPTNNNCNLKMIQGQVLSKVFSSASSYQIFPILHKLNIWAFSVVEKMIYKCLPGKNQLFLAAVIGWHKAPALATLHLSKPAQAIHRIPYYISVSTIPWHPQISKPVRINKRMKMICSCVHSKMW
jgi:hypothetical protein